MVLSKSDPRRISPVTGSRDSSFSRAAIDCSRLILIDETDSRPQSTAIDTKISSLNRRLPGPRTRRAQSGPTLQPSEQPNYGSKRLDPLFLRRKVAKLEALVSHRPLAAGLPLVFPRRGKGPLAP